MEGVVQGQSGGLGAQALAAVVGAELDDELPGSDVVVDQTAVVPTGVEGSVVMS